MIRKAKKSQRSQERRDQINSSYEVGILKSLLQKRFVEIDIRKKPTNTNTNLAIEVND